MAKEITRRIGRWKWLVSELRRVLAGNRSLLVGSLPALLIGGSVCVFASYVATIPADQRLKPYIEGAALGAKPGKHDLVLLCTERLIQEREADPMPRYAYAMILQADGDLAGAEAILSRLAPIDKDGYPPAHLALARSLLGGARRADDACYRATSGARPEGAGRRRRGPYSVGDDVRGDGAGWPGQSPSACRRESASGGIARSGPPGERTGKRTSGEGGPG